jgi:HD-like signal output (HDOD) protein
MASSARVLLLFKDPSDAERMESSLRRQGLEVTRAADATEAFKQMESAPCDLILCEAELKSGSTLPFLAQTRRQFPLTLRAIVENTPLRSDARSLVNEIAPSALYAAAPGGDEIKRLVALESPVSGVTDRASVDVGVENDKLRRLCKMLDGEKHALEKRVEQLEEQQREHTGGQAHAAAGSHPPAPLSVFDESEIVKQTVQLTEAIEKLLNSEEVILPILPEVGVEVQRLLADENSTFEMVAEKVGMEQGMSARILQVANSPLYAGLKRIRNLQQAVARLGMRQTRNLLQSVLAENLFRTESRSLARLMNQLWMHSLCTAHSNEQIALTLEIPMSADYFMMGLLHDIGKLLVLHVLDTLLKAGQWRKEDLSEEVVKGLMSAYHHEYGLKLIHKWRYSASYEEVVALHNDDQTIETRSETVVVTYFSNLLTRKLGYSLVPYSEDLLGNKILARALNMTTGTRYLLEENMERLVQDIRKAFQISF